jgi:hypothetical protein
VRASPIINTLNAGEFSPQLEGRTDLSKYPQACKLSENFLHLVQGPAERRGGTRYVAAVKDQSKRAWLVKFEFSATQAFFLEFGDLYVRFYTQQGVLLSGGLPYEIVSPYALADLTMDDGTCSLKMAQSGDVLYIGNLKRTYAPRKLTRVANTNWVFSLYQPDQGPLLEQNTSATTLQASASTGAVTITASAAIFAVTDVGRLVRLDVQNLDVLPWETNKGYVLNDLVRSDGKTYKALNGATSGTSTPVHEKGNAFDGKTGVQWAYMDSGYGIARISAFTDTTHVTANVIVDEPNGLKQLPVHVVSTTTTRWQLGQWSATTEYPGVVTFYKKRLWWFSKQRYAGSVPNDFENMSGDFFGEISADCAIWEQLQSDDVNDILFARGIERLVIGTGGGEFIAGPLTTTDPMGPGNFTCDPQSQRRVRGVAPLPVGTALVYVQRAGRKLLGMNYVLEQDKFASTDLAVLANRITRTGIVAMAYQGEPYSILWCVLANGKLLTFTYDQEQQVTGWGRHPIGGNGFVESVATGPSPDGSREEVWLIVRRTINGATKRYVEFIEKAWEGPDQDGTAGDAQEDAFYVDAGLTYDGAATSTITGLSHLEGQTVQILADGAVQPGKTVAGGSITLTRAASVVQVGLQAIARIVPLRPEAGAADGTSQGKIKRINKLIVRFIDTLGGKCGRFGGVLDDISLRSPSTPMGAAPPIVSGDHDVDFSGDYDTDALIEIRQDQPLPMTVAAIMPQLKTYP